MYVEMSDQLFYMFIYLNVHVNKTCACLLVTETEEITVIIDAYLLHDHTR